MARLARRDPFTIEWPEWFGRRFEDWWPERMHDMFGRGTMKVEEFADDGALVVRAELPGIDPDKDVEISVHDGLLHIKGERIDHEEETKKAFYRSEFTYGMFERTLPLPAGATEADVKATYKDGVLEVRIPMKSEATTAAKVPVQRVD
ncbi:MAG TPA: Hsp20/alpha crystallin family protein [Mycobacteriales bacterium]|nr:Hsp20/alpha crystallin family protein [Mycobacteriales bacterium]